MAFIVGQREQEMAKRGVYVMTESRRSFRHGGKCGGQFRLTRALNDKGEMSVAFFICLKCGDVKETAPGPNQAVQPMPSFGGAAFTPPVDGDANDGEWR